MGGNDGWGGECALPLHDEGSCVARSDEISEVDGSSRCRDESPCLFISRAERLGSVEGLSRRRLLSSPEGFPLRAKREETERSLPFRFRDWAGPTIDSEFDNFASFLEDGARTLVGTRQLLRSRDVSLLQWDSGRRSR